MEPLNIEDSKEQKEKYQQLAKFSKAQAEHYIKQGNVARAFPHLLLFGQMNKEEFKEEQNEQFISVVLALVTQLQQNGNNDKVEQVYNQALELLPSNPGLLTNYGSYLFNKNKTELAEVQYRTALASDPSYLEARDRLENLASSLVECWHFPMLNDRKRNSGFKTAIENRIREGGCKTVLDIGAGTGLLSLFAAGGGADRVYAIEAQEVMAVTAKDVFEHNPAGSCIKLISKLSLDLTEEDVPEKVDLLVTEIFDAGLLGEHVLETLAHAWSNLLEQGVSRVVPCKAEFIVAPLQCNQLARGHECVNDSMGYLKTSHCKVLIDNSEPYTTEQLARVEGGYTLLSQPETLFSLDLEDLSQITELIDGKVLSKEFQVSRDGRLDCIVGWFKLHLDERTVLDTGPLGQEEELCWDQAVFRVITGSKDVSIGSKIDVEFLVKKHVILQQVTTSPNVKSRSSLVGIVGCNGTDGYKQTSLNTDLVVTRPVRQVFYLPGNSILLFNDPQYQQVCQWLSYYLTQSTTAPLSLLDLTHNPPLLGLQMIQLRDSNVSLTLLVNTDQSQASKQILDWVTGVAAANSVKTTSSVDCITSISSTDSLYSVALVAPVKMSGRLNQDVLLGLDQVKQRLALSTGLLLPYKVEVWCCVVDSPQLASMSHLVSNDAVLGLKIADEVNVLSVTHHQEVNYNSLNKTELSDHTKVMDMDLTNLNLNRKEFVNQVTIRASGLANAVVYWFVQDFGWDVKWSTLIGTAFSQSVFLCNPTRVEEGGEIRVKCQTEKGLIHFQFC